MTAAFAVAALVGLVGIAAVFDAHAAVAGRAAGVGREFFAVVAELLHFAVYVFFDHFAGMYMGIPLGVGMGLVWHAGGCVVFRLPFGKA